MYPMRRSHGAEPGRRRSRTVVLTLAAVLLVGAGTSACQVSTKAADRIELCAKIFGKTFTDPFPDNVEEARKKMRDRADEPRRAGQAGRGRQAPQCDPVDRRQDAQRRHPREGCGAHRGRLHR